MPTEKDFRYHPGPDDGAGSGSGSGSGTGSGIGRDAGGCGAEGCGIGGDRASTSAGGCDDEAERDPMPVWGVIGAAGAAIGVAMLVLGVLHDAGIFVVLNDSPLFMGVGLTVIGGVLAATANASRGTVTERKSSYG
ncbi:MAG: hypothetical protein AB8G96_13195 [Phycisphaerales bacterium]